MGILNITPDSFSDGGKFISAEQAVAHALQMVNDGATIIDIGGESARPGAEPVSVEDELNRVIPVIEAIRKEIPDVFLSIDTTKYEVAKESLNAGVHILNDISGLQKDDRFVDLCETYEAGLIIMHSKGEPQTMQANPQYHDVIQEIKSFFFYQLQQSNTRLLNRVILDPGFGFGKTDKHNLEIAHRLFEFSHFGCPLLVGASRKTTIGSILNQAPVSERLIGTVAFHYDNLTKGAKIIRAHDVKPAFESILVYNAIKNQAL
ncbi:dihydropteroate synthase [bacterium]|nr:MAG: dihydropteroate synthase [bacterium]